MELGTTVLLNHHDLQMFGPKVNKYEQFYTHLRLYVAVTRHNFERVKKIVT